MSAFLVSTEGVIVVDAPASIGNKLVAAIREVTDQPVKFFVYSHHHADHVAGSAMFGADVTRVAHELTAAELHLSGDPDRPLPDVTFTQTHTIELGDQQVRLDYAGLNHAPGNTFIYLSRQKVLMLVDVLYAGWVPFHDFAMAADTRGFIRAFEQARKYDFEWYLGGHVNHPGTFEDFETAEAYVLDVLKHAGQALQATDYVTAAADVLTHPDPYVRGDPFLRVAANSCARALQQKWRNRLAGVDLYAESHCLTMIFKLYSR